jgi:tight adherence protein C
VNSFQLTFLISLLMSLGVGMAYWGAVKLFRTESPEERLERLASSAAPIEEAELELPFMDRVLKPWLRHQVQAAGRLSPSRDMKKLRKMLALAGYPYGLTPLDVVGLRLLLSLGLAAVCLLGLRGLSVVVGLVVTVGATTLGFFMPDIWLGLRVRRRKREIRRTLPDALDMMTICVDAGSGLDAAMLNITQKWDNAIAAEFGKVVGELRIGLTRKEALQNMVTRTDVPEMTSFVAVLHQADEFGLSIANVLHTQSEQLRVLRRQRAEEEARKVPIKLLFPLIFMIFPSMIAVTIGPAVPVLIRTFASMGR